MFAADCVKCILPKIYREETHSAWLQRRRVRRLPAATCGLNYGPSNTILAGVGFNGWVSIEDGVDQVRRTVQFLRAKMAKYWRA
jgi:sugar phosphate isomerase/epimerase